jgi:DNA-binding transcriptional LysR family regulator
MRIDIGFLDVKAFLAVKETASLHRAAERLGRSLSSITRRVRKLAHALGATLFERSAGEARSTARPKPSRLHAR